METINEQIIRLETAKSDIETAIETCGVNVPDGDKIDTYAARIKEIPAAVFSQFNLDQVGGDNKYIQSVSQSNGMISASAGDITSTVAENSTALITSGGVYSKVIKYLPLAGGKMTGALTSQNIIPDTNNTYNLGRESLKWINVYATTFTGNLNGSIVIKDIRSLTGVTSDFSEKTFTPFFSNVSMPSTYWWSGFTSKGWTNDYNSWQLAGLSNLSDSPASDLHWRNGRNDTWNSWKKILDDSNTTYTPIITSSTSGAYEIGTLKIGDTETKLYGKDTTTATNATNVYIDTSTGSSYYPMTFVTTTGVGNKKLYIDSSTGTSLDSNGIRYNPSSKTCYCSGGFYEASDERLKNFGDDIEVDLDKLSKLSKKYFTWKDGESNTQHIGVSAQEVQAIYPELVNVIDEEGHLSVSYDKLSVIALKGIDVLYNKVSALEERLSKLEKLIN